MELIGRTTEALRAHLESQFTNDMSWSNYGTFWHVDHRFPISSFDLSDRSQQELAFNYNNLQPLPALGNLLKGSNIIH